MLCRLCRVGCVGETCLGVGETGDEGSEGEFDIVGSGLQKSFVLYCVIWIVLVLRFVVLCFVERASYDVLLCCMGLSCLLLFVLPSLCLNKI